MQIVNPALYLRAVGTLFYIFDYEHFEEVQGLDRWGALESDADRCAFVVERDVCVWVRTWSRAALDRLQATLDFYLEHDPTSLIERAQQEYEFWTKDPMKGVWYPLYHGVFGHDHIVRDRSEYELLESDVDQLADLDTLGFTYDPYRWFDAAVGGGLIGNEMVFEPSPPDWPWLEPIGLAAYERRLHGYRKMYVQPFPDQTEERYPWETYLGLSLEQYQALGDNGFKKLHGNRFERFGHRVSSQGLAALSQARERGGRGETDWFHEGPALLGQPTFAFSHYGNGHVFCNEDRMDEPTGAMYLKISNIDDLFEALRLAAIGLGLDLQGGMREAAEQAQQWELERPSPFHPYSTWSILVELALRTRNENLFLYV